MRADYEPFLQKLLPAIAELGYARKREGDLLAQFFLFSGWVVEMECEPHYGPAFTISVVSPNAHSGEEGQQKYAVWMLMEIFEEKTGKEYGKPTIGNQAKFLIEEKERLFANPCFYDADYVRRNNII